MLLSEEVLDVLEIAAVVGVGYLEAMYSINSRPNSTGLLVDLPMIEIWAKREGNGFGTKVSLERTC